MQGDAIALCRCRNFCNRSCYKAVKELLKLRIDGMKECGVLTAELFRKNSTKREKFEKRH